MDRRDAAGCPRTRRIGVAAAAMALGAVGALAAVQPAAAEPAAAEPATGGAAAAAPVSAAPGVAADVDHATWQADVKTVIDQALPYVRQRTAHADGQQLALVFDVDNTTLETGFHPWYELPTPPVQPSLELARYAESRGVSVIFVTARPGILRGETGWNLKAAGYPVDGLHVRDLPALFEELSAYKTGEREAIEAQGYTIIANVGNSDSDLVGGHAERTFKLPDYDGQLS